MKVILGLKNRSSSNQFSIVYVERVELQGRRVDGFITTRERSKAFVFDTNSIKDRRIVASIFQLATAHDFDSRDDFFVGIEIIPKKAA